MGLFRRRSGRVGSPSIGSGRHRPGTTRTAGKADIAHLTEFARTRRGVEGFVEPRTAVTETTIVLVATDGEWTRRRIAGPDGARALGRQLGIPVYDVTIVGYPPRMRAWNARQRTGEGAGDARPPQG